MPSRSIGVERKGKPAPPRRRSGGRLPQAVQLAAALFAVLLAINAVVGEHGLVAMLQARQGSAAMREKLTRAQAENQRLEEQIERLKNDPAAIEEIARRKLGLIRRGEKVFIITDLPSPAKP